MFFHCHEMCLHWFFTVKNPVIFLKYTFEFVLNTFFLESVPRVAGYSEGSSNRLRSILSKLCISVPLSTSCTDLTIQSKLSANRGCYLQSSIHCQLLPVRFKQDASGLRTKYAFQRNGTVYLFIYLFFSENSTDFVFQKFPEEN